VNFAIDQLQKDERDLDWLKRELRKAAEALERGEGTPWDVEEEKARLLRRVARQRKSA
jgi:Arc/MetJ-type ribon-helix-helix transcriptional regulator